jgi:hypothetical protein
VIQDIVGIPITAQFERDVALIAVRPIIPPPPFLEPERLWDRRYISKLRIKLRATIHLFPLLHGPHDPAFIDLAKSGVL